MSTTERLEAITKEFVDQLALKISTTLVKSYSEIDFNFENEKLSFDGDKDYEIVWAGDYDPINDKELRRLVMEFLVKRFNEEL